METQRLVRRVRIVLGLFVVGLVLSGLTAFPLVWEGEMLDRAIGEGTWMQQVWPAMAAWMSRVNRGIAETARAYPFLAYGTDWLAFAHIVIGLAFLGPLVDPVRNIWVIHWAMIACVGVIPLAMICGPVRDIPWWWRMLDCSFGVVGILPLWLVHRDIRRIETQT
jgi:hypothetical protein